MKALFRILTSGGLKRALRDARVVVIAVIATTFLAGAPAMAAYDSLNADSVDGHDAVGALGKPAKRAGKLVATNKSGYLPNNIIRKAPDSARFAGKNRSSFVERTSDVGELQTGVWAVSGTGAARGSAGVRFLEDLHSPISGPQIFFVQPGASTVQCPGPGEVVAQGVLCVYVTQGSNLASLHARDPFTGAYGASTQGVVIMADFDSDGFAFGTWAVRSAG